MPERTDIHRPSAIIPTEYEWVAYELVPIGRFGGDILADCAFLQDERARIARHMARTGGKYSTHEHGGNCMVCGSVNAIYTVLFYHALTNTYVRMGQDCAQKCEMACGGNFDAFKTAALNALELHAGKRKAQAILTDAGLPAAWAIYITNYTGSIPYEESTVMDIVGKLVRYGSVSEKALNYIRILLSKIANRAETEARRKAEVDAAAPLPGSGRMVVEGTVLTVKVQTSAFGDVTKMLVKADAGWKVWGTRPSKTNVERGDRIRFTATVTASNDDPKFGFFCRPSGAEVLARAAA